MKFELALSVTEVDCLPSEEEGIFSTSRAEANPVNKLTNSPTPRKTKHAQITTPRAHLEAQGYFVSLSWSAEVDESILE